MAYAYSPLGEDPAAFSYWQACGCCRVGSSLSPAQNLSFPGSRTLPSDDHRPIKGTSQVAFVALGRLELAQKYVIFSRGTFDFQLSTIRTSDTLSCSSDYYYWWW